MKTGKIGRILAVCTERLSPEAAEVKNRILTGRQKKIWSRGSYQGSADRL